MITYRVVLRKSTSETRQTIIQLPPIKYLSSKHKAFAYAKELFHLGIDTYVDRKNQRSGDWDQIGGYMGSTAPKFYKTNELLNSLL